MNKIADGFMKILIELSRWALIVIAVIIGFTFIALLFRLFANTDTIVNIFLSKLSAKLFPYYNKYKDLLSSTLVLIGIFLVYEQIRLSAIANKVTSRSNWKSKLDIKFGKIA
jgi:hypothetical protein